MAAAKAKTRAASAALGRARRKKSQIEDAATKRAGAATPKGGATRRSGVSISAAARARQASAAYERLAEAVPDPRCELNHKDAWQLLVATILSAQSTDARVNLVTPALFERYPTPAALAKADLAELEVQIRSTGFFRNKAKAITAASRMLVERHGGEVPRTLHELIELPGVARKTANVVLGTAYGVPSGVIVDTHAGRVARRLGFTKEEDPEKVERDLCELFPEESWVALGHRLVLHGRYVCTARNPACQRCPLHEICPSAEGEVVESLPDRMRWEAGKIGPVAS